MDPIESVEYNGVDDHGNRKQKPIWEMSFIKAAARNENLKATEREKPDWEASLAKSAAEIGPSDLTHFLDRTPDTYPTAESFRIARFLDFYESALAEVPCPWREMFKDSDLSNLFHVPIFVTLAMVVSSKPHVLTMVLPSLKTKRKYQGQGHIPLTVWLIAQASQDNLPVGLYSWAHNLLPLVPSKPQSMDLILKLVERILAKPNAPTILVNAPVWKGQRLIPPYSFAILLELTFPDTSEREEATSRFEAIYPLLKKVALAGTLGSEEIKQIFTYSLILSGQGNTVLDKEAMAIAIWSLTENDDCWKHWYNIYKKNQGASIALLKMLVGQYKDGTLGSEAMIQQIFKFSLKLAGKGNPVLPKKVTASYLVSDHNR